MHILLIHQAFAALQEPGGTRHHEFARYLVEHGHHVTVIASPVSYLTGKTSTETTHSLIDQNHDGLTILRSYTYNALHRSFVHRIFSFLSFTVSSFFLGLQIRKVDLVWGTSPPIFQAVSAWALAKSKRTPFLLEVRDLWPAFAIAVGVLRNPILIRLSSWLEKFLYRHADKIMVNSPGFIDHVQSKGGVQVSLVANGSDPRMFSPNESGSEFRQKHNLGNKFVVLYAGAHGMSNDLEVVLHTAHILRDHSNIIFVLLGDGKDKPLLIRKAQELGLENIRFLPPIPKLEMPQALAAANACIAILKPIPLYATVYPNKVFDYMAAGKPVLLAIEGVIRQVVVNVNAGIPIPPGSPTELAEAVEKLANHPELGINMGINGRKYIEENFDRAVLARQLEQIMQNLVD